MERPPETEGLVSVVLPTYNRARTLVRAVNSVLHQSYSRIELIIVDDASTDDTETLVATIADPRVRYVRLAKNGGASRARNEGMRIAKGDYIAFQDSDDEWLADKLERTLGAARAVGDPEDPVTVFHTKVMYISGGVGEFKTNRIVCIPELPHAASREILIHEIHRGNLVSPQTLLISRGALNAVGFFDENLVNCEDWDYGISLIYKTKTVFLDEPLVMTYLQSDSISLLGRRGARSQLRLALKLMRNYEVESQVIGARLSKVGWWISKLGNPRLGRRVLRRSIRMAPGDWRTWARLAASQALGLRNRFRPRPAKIAM
ncbi:glycosyltransferase [Phenylobacterium sp. LH3H17]|uniref:glycosyltransferase family 2 protein n=1 Tax=Phenylobacterium sp. LH3H17 TaxID=2903901 RepID=UPI0020C9B7AC|nr:glycosyltransferase family 2 protein [Phenylobacterium sp. LH3H17]UTP40977.1 glycosyltransferase [Phenylobacterium sp. LH3H17]